MISLAYGLDTCPDYRQGGDYADSNFICGGGISYENCNNADENDATCKGPEYTCNGVMNFNDEDFSCVRCNYEDGYIGRAPYCVTEEEEYNHGAEDDFDESMSEIISDDNIILAQKNTGRMIVIEPEDERCCAKQGEVPDEYQLCCNNMPLDGPITRIGHETCGCPSGFNWVGDHRNPDGTIGACLFARRPCYAPQGGEQGWCDKDPRDNLLAWLSDRNCFMDFLGRGEGEQQPPYEYACCPANFNDYGERWSFDNPDSRVIVY